MNKKTLSHVQKTPPARISYVNEGMLCKIKTKGRRQDGNKSGSGRVLWQISWWMEANCAIHQRTRLVECFKSEFNWRYQNSESISFFYSAVLEKDEMPNSCIETIKQTPRSLYCPCGMEGDLQWPFINNERFAFQMRFFFLYASVMERTGFYVMQPTATVSCSVCRQTEMKG